ncbi:hypothetical protein [Gemmata sp.]|uniref:hypothetical protein n=1 Tax=Gemmata sp. TaxID=1914242 RepID=UPI003F719F06
MRAKPPAPGVGPIGRQDHRERVAAAQSEIGKLLTRMAADATEPKLAAWVLRMTLEGRSPEAGSAELK